ncbi:MAG TPA: TIGR03086 family metal-binding protein [Actinomycetota bacterium]|nr:TIGR03086 family metal-binding protein [Actinomycetota bacterium]
MDVAMFERAVQATGKIVAGTSKEDMEKSTPCTEWNVRDLLNHLIGSFETVAAAAGAEITNAASTDFTATDHVAAYEGAAAKSVKALAAPGALERTYPMPWGDTPGEVLLGLMIADTVVHGWDLAKGTGQDATVDPEMAEAVYGMTSKMMQPLGSFPREPAFGPPVEVPDDAPVGAKMLAYLGRKP